MDSVFAVLVASPEALAVAEIAKRAKLDAIKTGAALQRLKAQGKAFNAGRSIFGRWAITQDAADEAVAELRRGQE